MLEATKSNQSIADGYIEKVLPSVPTAQAKRRRIPFALAG